MGGLLIHKRKKIPKSAKQMERHLKGIANHWRIEILLLVNSKPGITVEDLVESLNAHYTTLSIHIAKLVHAGLLDKKYRGRNVGHTLTPYGKAMVTFISTFQHY